MPFIASVDRFENREISDHTRIDDWFSEKVDSYRCPAGLGPEGQALRGIHARGLGVLAAKLHVSDQALPTLPEGSVRPAYLATPPHFDVICVLNQRWTGGSKVCAR